LVVQSRVDGHYYVSLLLGCSIRCWVGWKRGGMIEVDLERSDFIDLDWPRPDQDDEDRDLKYQRPSWLLSLIPASAPRARAIPDFCSSGGQRAGILESGTLRVLIIGPKSLCVVFISISKSKPSPTLREEETKRERRFFSPRACQRSNGHTPSSDFKHERSSHADARSERSSLSGRDRDDDIRQEHRHSSERRLGVVERKPLPTDRAWPLPRLGHV
jgi:hypothetical protein